MVVVAAHRAAVSIEVDADWTAPVAPRTRTAMAVRREVGLVDWRGGHRRRSYTKSNFLDALGHHGSTSAAFTGHA